MDKQYWAGSFSHYLPRINKFFGTVISAPEKIKKMIFFGSLQILKYYSRLLLSCRNESHVKSTRLKHQTEASPHCCVPIHPPTLCTDNGFLR